MDDTKQTKNEENPKKHSSGIFDKEKRKKYLSIGALVIAAVAIVLIAISGWDDADPLNNRNKPTLAPEQIMRDPTISDIPTVPGIPSGTLPPIDAGENVKIYQVPIRDGAVIDRDPAVSRNHPEYIEETTGTGPYISQEGKVYKNDRYISIDVFDRSSADIVTFTFGMATGEYNRFLYLNPHQETSDSDPYSKFFRFDASAGFLLEAPQAYASRDEMKENCKNYSIRRAIDQASAAEYVDPKHPGTVWFTTMEIEEPIYIDVNVYTGDGSLRFLLRLWIDKDENGCYYFANIENRDLYDNTEKSTFDDKELYHIYEVVKADIQDKDKIGMTISKSQDVTFDDFLYDHREIGEGCYYAYFRPANSRYSAATKEIASFDTLAITLRGHGGWLTVTLYYHVVVPPMDGAHGVYVYAGRDYTDNGSIESLQMQGYPGYD